MNWRELPFVRMFIPFALGIISVILWEKPIPNSYLLMGLLLLLLSASTLLSIPYKKRWVHGLILFAFLFLAGQQTYSLNRDDHQPHHFSKHLAPHNTLVALIQTPPTGKGRFLQCRLEVLELAKPDTPSIRVNGKLHVLFPRDELTEQLDYGDLIRFDATILPAKTPNNPKDFDFAWYLKTQNCFYQAFVKPGQIQLLQREQGHPLLQLANRSRQHLIQLLLDNISGRHEAAVAIALSLGDRDHIDRELKAAYAGTGATHVLAVSGLHVGLVYLALTWLLIKTGIKGARWWLLRIGFLLAGIWSYALLTGASPSVLRAATMFSFLTVGDNLHRHASIYNTLAVSAFCLLWVSPNLVISPGFQLSYAAVVGIVYFQPKIYRLWYIDNWLGDYCWKLTAVSLAAQLTTLPFTLYYFHQFPLYFWLSGLVVVPAAMLILPLCFVLFFLSFIAPILLWPFSQLLYGIVWLTNAVIFFVSELPGSLIRNIWISAVSFLLFYVFLINIAALINTRKTKWFLGGLASILLLTLSFSFTKINQQQQEQLVIYHHSKHTLIDIFYGTNALVLRDSLLDEKEELKLSENHRSAAGIKQIETKLINSHANNTFLFGGKSWHLLQAPFLPPDSIHYLFINHFTKKDIAPYLKSQQLELVIFGASNKPWMVKEWKEICDRMGIKTYVIQRSGAFVFSPENEHNYE